MSTWSRRIPVSFRGWTWATGAVGTIVLFWTVLLGSRASDEPRRCASGLVPLGARCCAPGQGHSTGRCVGAPKQCPVPFVLSSTPTPGCVFPRQVISLPAGSVTLGPTDWDSVEVVERQTISVRAFAIDRIEVTHHEFERCVRSGACAALGDSAHREPGLPVTGIDAKAAEAYCAFHSGRLPTPAEWLYAASGPDARRFPWGPHGLVCRRAAFGLVDGPCANEGILPDFSGAHPQGQTPEGLLDMAGNVAEWTRAGDGTLSVRGGSFRSKTARELKVWSSNPPEAGDDVGFRCAYDR